jgi:predicted component of type VI protein secretion system
MPFLEHGSNSIEVTPGELLVGSGAQATWRVLNSDLAARHFTVRLDKDGTALVRPYSPSTIVVVNGVPAAQHGTIVRPGDVIAAGLARFAFLERLDSPRPPRPDAGERGAYLIDERERRAFPLARRSVGIGRESGAAIPVREPTVSRFHADVRAEAGEFVLYSMGSAGTHVNGLRVGAPRVLAEGDTIQIGSVTFRFTRGPLPEGLSVARTEEEEDADDVTAGRSKTTLGGVDDIPTMQRTPRRSGLVAVVLVAAVLIAIAAWFVFGMGGR